MEGLALPTTHTATGRYPAQLRDRVVTVDAVQAGFAHGRFHSSGQRLLQTPLNNVICHICNISHDAPPEWSG